MASTDVLDIIEILLSCVHSNGKHASDAYLIERERVAKLKKVHLSGLTPGMLLLAIDERRKIDNRNICMSPLFSPSEIFDHNRACDYVLLKQDAEGIHVYYIELKSDNPSGFAGQFKSTQCFMRYVFDLVENICTVRLKKGREKFIVFHTDSKNARRRSINKTPTKFKANGANTPNSPSKIVIQNESTISCTAIFR